MVYIRVADLRIMKKLFFLVLFMTSMGIQSQGLSQHQLFTDLKLRGIPLIGDTPTNEEQERLVAYFDSAIAARPIGDPYSICYDYNRDVAPLHKGHYYITYTNPDGEEKSFDCVEPSVVDGIPVLSQVWNAVKWFLWFLLSCALPVISFACGWKKSITIAICVICAVPILITGFGLVMAALASLWAIICVILMAVVTVGAAISILGFLSDSVVRGEAIRRVNQRPGYYDRQRAIDEEMQKIYKDKKKKKSRL